MAIQNQFYVTDYFSTEIEAHNESQIRDKFPIEYLTTESGYYPAGAIYCQAYNTRFIIPPLSSLAPDWELLEFTLHRASEGKYYPYRRCELGAVPKQFFFCVKR